MVDKNVTFSLKQYKGHNNEEIISLINQLNDILCEKKLVENRIKEIQNNCKHDYELEYETKYEFIFCCIHCGHEIIK